MITNPNNLCRYYCIQYLRVGREVILFELHLSPS